MIRLLLIVSSLATLLLKAQEEPVVIYPPDVIADHRLTHIKLITRTEMELGKLPKHPKITWLGYSSVRLPNKQEIVDGRVTSIMQTENRIDFIATSPGLIEFPPIPIALDNREFFIRVGDIRVEKNEASKTDSQLEVRWNSGSEIPRQVHLGEAVEVEFRQLVLQKEEDYSLGPKFSLPSNRVNGGQWHQFTRIQGRKAVPSDYYLSKSRGIFFSRFRDPYDSPSIYQEYPNQNLEGKYYTVRVYKTRLYFTKLGKATGHLSATMGTSGASNRLRTHVLPFEIEVLPIPPLPNDQAIDTGLIGDWDFEADFRPARPRAAQPFEINIEVTGLGNPQLRNQIDISCDGFPSVESSFEPRVSSNWDFWEGEFTQTLLPTGKVGTLPAITLASFDTVGDQWRFKKITPAFTLPGFENIADTFTPRKDPGSSITRPVLLNLPVATFGAFAIAPLIPFLFGFVKKRLDARDPEADERARVLKRIIQDFKNGKGSSEIIDNDLLPILRHKLDLPAGATAREIADALDAPDLAESLHKHAESSFSTTAAPVDLKSLAAQLAKFSILILLTFSGLRGASLEEANQFFEKANYREAINGYRELLKESPNRASLHVNLAQAYLSSNDAARARASCHTALLLNPLDKDARELMSEIRERQGDLTVARNRFLDLRPDQWIIVAAFFWIIGFLYFGIRKFCSIPRWPGFVITALALIFLGTAAWRQTHDYAADQYMVLAEELPREPEAGTPDWDYPPLRAGQIVRVIEVNPTHARISSSDSSFWLPVNELQQVW